VIPPSIGALKQRLEKRGTETEKTLAVRLANASSEIGQCLFQTPAALATMNEVGDKDVFNSCLIGYRVVNDDLEESVPAFLSIIESLYASELGLTKESAKEEETSAKEEETPAGSSNALTYGMLGLAAAGAVGGIMMKQMNK